MTAALTSVSYQNSTTPAKVKIEAIIFSAVPFANIILMIARKTDKIIAVQMLNKVEATALILSAKTAVTAIW